MKEIGFIGTISQLIILGVHLGCRTVLIALDGDLFKSRVVDQCIQMWFMYPFIVISYRFSDLESEDYDFYKGLDYLLKHDVSELGYDITFCTEVRPTPSPVDPRNSDWMCT